MVSGPTAGAASETKAQHYNFVFQVITYKNSNQAETFREKLENAGLRTRLQMDKDKQGKPRFHRIQVLLQGTDADADQIREVLIRHGAKEPTVVSRKPI